MLTKAKKKKKNPIYLLAVIVSLAVLGVGSVLAVRALADGEGGSSVPEGYEEYTVKRLFFQGEASRAVIKAVNSSPQSTSGLQLYSPSS